MKSYRVKLLFVIVALCALCGACAEMSQTQKGAGVGSLVGGGLGALAGHNIRGISTTEGAVAGALVGGLLGGVVGNQQDKMNQQQQQINAVGAQANSTVVNVTNSNGSTTPVILRRVGNQWQGPRGEMYGNLPTEDLLRGVYGF